MGNTARAARGRAVRVDYAPVSHDGKNVYVASLFSDAIAVFARDKTTGELIELDTTLGGA